MAEFDRNRRPRGASTTASANATSGSLTSGRSVVQPDAFQLQRQYSQIQQQQQQQHAPLQQLQLRQLHESFDFAPQHQQPYQQQRPTVPQFSSSMRALQAPAQQQQQQQYFDQQQQQYFGQQQQQFYDQQHQQYIQHPQQAIVNGYALPNQQLPPYDAQTSFSVSNSVATNQSRSNNTLKDPSESHAQWNNQKSHRRDDSDSQVELVSMRRKGSEVQEDEDEGDDEYLDEIYQIIDAVVPRTDDPSLPVLTFRVWLIGLFFGTLICIANTIFTFRTNQVVVTAFVVVLLAYPIGRFMANTLPSGVLNPGKFNFKEHALIYVIVNSMGATPYALYNIVAQKYQLYQDVNFFACFLFAIVTQCFGYGFAGLTRRFLVRPPAMLWPSNFATIAMLNSLHENEDVSMGRYPMSRFKFFWLACSAMFFYTFLPQYAAPMLGALSVICWFTNNKPNNTLALALGSSSPGAGMGFMSITLDWSLYTTSFAPITTPLWAMYNQFFGLYVTLWIVVPLCWYFNVFGIDQQVGSSLSDSQYGFSLNTPFLYNKNGERTPTTQYVNTTTLSTLNTTYYEMNKPVHITTYFAVNYATSFTVFVSAIVHVGLWYGKDIWNRFKTSLKDLDNDDVHARLMDAYPDVPDWWYYILLVVTALAGMFVCQFGGFTLPWWGVLLAIALALVSMIPIGIIQAISGQQIGLNVMSEFLIGLILPGRISAVMAFKTFSYMAMYQGLLLVQDLKLGHYIKIPPRSMFISQLLATIFGSILSTGVAMGLYQLIGTTPVDPALNNGRDFEWTLQISNGAGSGIPGWDSSGYNTFLSAGAIWGAIGPAEFFGPNSPYFKTLLGFVVGAVLPIIPWIMHKIQPDSFWHLINVPLIVIMPVNFETQQSVYITPLAVAIIVNFYIKKYRHTWWKKYAYV
ncbi:hypothetical protein HK100_002161, partial [Physocladia obscura]